MDTFQSCQKDNLKMITYRYLLDSTATWEATNQTNEEKTRAELLLEELSM